MKLKFLPLLLVLGVLILSCQKKEAAQINSENTEVSESNAAASVFTQGYALRVNTGFYTTFGEDTGDETTRTKWAASLALGEKISVGEIRRLTFDNNSVVQDWVAVWLDNGTKGWATTAQVAKDCRLAVVKDEKANLYSKPRTIDVSSVVLSRGSVVAYFPETESDGFVEVRGWDIVREQYVAANNAYVRLSALSRNSADIDSVILYQTALSVTAANQSERRDVLLKSAVELYPDSIFFQEIYKAAYPNSTFQGSIDPIAHNEEDEGNDD